MSFTYTVTLLCDSRASPECQQSVERPDAQPGTMDGRNQLMGQMRHAGWAFGRENWDDIGRAVCPACLPLDRDAADAHLSIGDVQVSTEHLASADEQTFRHLLHDAGLDRTSP